MSPGSPQVRVSEAARQLELPKSSVSRLLKQLTEGGLLERDGDRGFRAGPELFRLGTLYRTRLPVEARVDEELRHLVHRHGATAYVGVFRGMDLVVLRRHESTSPVRFIQEPGSVIPAFATAVGKALLARRPEEEIAAALPDTLSCAGREVAMTRDQLLHELVAVRRQGYAMFDDRLINVGAVGVAVQISTNRDLGFAICFTRENVSDARRDIIAAELKDMAGAIGAICDVPTRTAHDPKS